MIIHAKETSNKRQKFSGGSICKVLAANPCSTGTWGHLTANWDLGGPPTALTPLTQTVVLPDNTLGPLLVYIIARAYPPGVSTILKHLDSSFSFLECMINPCNSRQWCSLNGEVVKISIDKTVAKKEGLCALSGEPIYMFFVIVEWTKMPPRRVVWHVRDYIHCLRKEAVSGIADYKYHLIFTQRLPSSMFHSSPVPVIS